MTDPSTPCVNWHHDLATMVPHSGQVETPQVGGNLLEIFVDVWGWSSLTPIKTKEKTNMS